MGSQAPNASALTTYDAIQLLTPRAVFVLGIAFGASRRKCRLGDVLVGESIAPYELAKIRADGTTHRGRELPAAPILVQRFRAYVDTWKHYRGEGVLVPVHFGLVISGEKIIDNLQFLKSLQESYETAIGGEMEGTGAYSAATRSLPPTPILLVKSVCDFADGFKNSRAQPFAARASVSLCEYVLSQPDAIKVLLSSDAAESSIKKADSSVSINVEPSGISMPLEYSAQSRSSRLVVLDRGHNLRKWDRGDLPRLTAEYRSLASTAAISGYLIEERNLGDFSLDLLKGVELIVLVNPRDSCYSLTEIDHLVQFTRSGGSLLILAYYWWKSDHDSNTGAVAAEFGIHLRDDRLYDPKRYDKNEYRLLCSCPLPELTDKPIVIPFCCSMEIDDHAESILVCSSSAKSERVKLTDRGIVRQFETIDAGALITGARAKVKAGKVVVLGSWEIGLDQTLCRSEFGNQEFMKGVLTWLTRE